MSGSPEYIVRSNSCKDGHRPPSSERAARRAAWPASKTQQGQPPCRPKAPAPSTLKLPTSQESSPGRAEILVPATKPFSVVKTFARMRLAGSPEYIVSSHTCKDGHRPPSSERAARRAAWPASNPAKPTSMPSKSTCSVNLYVAYIPVVNSRQCKIFVPATKPISLGENGGQNAIGRITRVYR